MRVLFVQNCELEGIGFYGPLLEQGGCTVDVHPAWRGGPFPSPEDFDLVLAGGTPIAAYDAEDHAFLRDELRFLSRVLELDLPYLGICAGGQLLARVLGAEVGRNPVREIGGYEVELTAEGANDPLFAGFPARFPVFHWHGDTFEVPADATLLATGEACRNQAFRRGRAVALQFHLEVGPEAAGAWAEAYAAELPPGKTAADVRGECAAGAPAMNALAEHLIGNLRA